MAEILVALGLLTKEKRRSNSLMQYGILHGGGFSAAGNNRERKKERERERERERESPNVKRLGKGRKSTATMCI